MPRVPQLEGQQIQQNPLPNIRVDESVNREAFNVGESKQRLDNTIYDIADKAKKAADQVSVQEAENELTNFENDFQYNPETGMFRKEGKDAFGLIELSREQYDKKVSEISGKILKNDVQRNMFNEKASVRKLQFDKSVMGHVGAQIQKYDDTVTTSTIKLNQDNAINNYQDQDAITLSLSNQGTAYAEYADRHGLPQVWVEDKIKEAQSKTHSKIIERIATNGDDIMAEDYYKKNSHQIQGEDKTQVEKLLEISSTRGKAQRFTDEVMAKGMDESRAIKEAGIVFKDDPRRREAAEQRIDRMYSLKKQADQQRQEDLVNLIADDFDKTGEISPKWASALASLDKNHAASLVDYANKNPVRDDGVMYYQLREMAENPKTRDEFKKKDLTDKDIWNNLSKENRNKLITLQSDLRTGKDKAAKELDGSLSDAQIMQDVFAGAGYKDKKDFANFRQSVDAEILKTKQEKGKAFLNNDEVREIANKLVKEKVIKGAIWNSNVPSFKITIDKVPAKDRANIEAALKKQNKPLTNKNIIDLYLLNNGNKLDE